MASTGTKVTRIESFTVPGATDGKVNFPELAITFSPVSAAIWTDWFTQFVIDGNHDDSAEKSGKITFLLPDLKTALATIELSGLGNRKPGKNGRRTERSRRYNCAGLYCERMSLQHAQT